MQNRRVILNGMGASLALGLSGCSGTALKMPSSSSSSSFNFSGDGISQNEKPKSDVFLDEKGLPSIKDLMKEGPLGDKWLGDKKAPITILKFASMTCPYCRVFHLQTYPHLKQKYIDTGKVRFTIREFPIGFASGRATLIMRCLGQNDTKKYYALYDKLITQQNRWVSLKVRNDAIFRVASQVGITRKQFDSCLTNQAMIDGVKWSKQRGRNLGVTGTPTFFINGQKFREVLTVKKIDSLLAPYLS